MWRAIRHGLDGRMIACGGELDLACGEEYPSAQIAERLLTWTAPLRAELEITLPGAGELVLPERNGSQRQRAMIESGASIHEVYDTTVRETRATYAEEVTA